VTFSVLACDVAEGLLGMAQASSPMAVGARCMHLRPSTGVVASQGNTDPALGARLLDLLAQGLAPAEALAALEGTPLLESRQLAAVDAAGRVAACTGRTTEPHKGHLLGEHVVVLGNHLASPQVLPAMKAAFLAAPRQPFEARLMATVIAGRDAGGDRSGCRSAAIRVAGRDPQPRTDLRVDWSPGGGGIDAVDALAALVRRWLPLIPYYLRRPSDPSVGDWESWSPAP
jgi:uncharacterized Ntn-hydrolase superfamily protein